MTFTSNELQFMTVLWNAGEPLTSAEILRASTDKTWKDASLHTILTKLLQKGALKEVGFKKDGKAISRTFEPAVSFGEYYAELLNSYSKKDSAAVPLIFSALLKRDDVTDETIRQLEEIIEKKKAELD